MLTSPNPTLPSSRDKVKMKPSLWNLEGSILRKFEVRGAHSDTLSTTTIKTKCYLENILLLNHTMKKLIPLMMKPPVKRILQPLDFAKKIAAGNRICNQNLWKDAHCIVCCLACKLFQTTEIINRKWKEKKWNTSS